MENEENKFRRDSFCQNTFQVVEFQGLQLYFLVILLALFCSVFQLPLNLVTKQQKQFKNTPTMTMTRERRLLLQILLKEWERSFPQDPSKTGFHSLLTFESINGKGKEFTSISVKPIIKLGVRAVSPEWASSSRKKSGQLNKVGIALGKKQREEQMLGRGPSHLGQGEVALMPTAYGPWKYTGF